MWELCEEMDYENFAKSFLIPELSFFLKVLNSAKNDKELLIKFYSLWGPALFYTTHLETGEPVLHIYRDGNFFAAIIDNYEVYDYRLFSHFIENNNLRDEVLKILSIKLNHDIEPDKADMEIEQFIHDNEVEQILIKNGIYEVVKEYKKSIQAKIKLIEENLKKRSEDLKDLLDY